MALDQGTGSSKAILFDAEGREVSCFQRETTMLFPRQGWVEQNAMKIWLSVRSVLNEAVAAAGEAEIAAIGLTNQRETTIVWDALTGRPVCNAIVWQDRRTSEYCDQIRAHGLEEMVRQKTGLIVDAYFSATKIRWMLDNVPGAMAKARAGRLRFGTMDSWLVWNLTGGKVHVTDVTNASRTMLFNINTLQWDSELLNFFGIPESMMPMVCDSSGIIGETQVQGRSIPIAGIIGDQQSALFGQMCVEEGAVKNTYGTGCFLLMNCGHKPVFSENRLLTTVAWKIGDRVDYALEGSIFVAGAVVRWLRDGLGIIRDSSEIEALATSVPDSGGVYFRSGVDGHGSPLLGSECSRHHSRPDAGGDRRPYSQGRPGGHSLPDHGRCGGHGKGCRNTHFRAEGRRRGIAQRPHDAVPGRHTRNGGHTFVDFGSHRPGCCLHGRTGRWGMEVAGRAEGPLGVRQALLP